MLTVIFFITTLFLAWQCLKRHIALSAMMIYCIRKGYPEPEPVLLEFCVSQAIRQMFYPKKRAR